MKRVTKIVTVALLLIMPVGSRASITLSLSPLTQTVQKNHELFLDVSYDTGGETTVGGAFSVNFNNMAFDFIGVEFDAGFPAGPFRVFEDTDINDNVFDLGFGDFSGITGAGKVATLAFFAQHEGFFDFSLDNPIGGHASFFEGVEYVNADVAVNSVPIPTALWFLLSSLISLVVARRQ